MPKLPIEQLCHDLGHPIAWYDLAEGLPPESVEALAIIDWCTGEELPDPVGYLRWLHRQIDGGVRYLLLGKIAFLKQAGSGRLTPQYEIRELFTRIGLRYLDHRNNRPCPMEILYKDPQRIDHERRLATEDLSSYYTIESIDPRNRVYLRLQRKERSTPPSVGLVVGPRGWYALDGCSLFALPNGQNRWIINPYLVFKEALGLVSCHFDYGCVQRDPLAWEGFEEGLIERRESGGWLLSRFGRCQTLCLEEETRFPDLIRSSGILGFEHRSGSLYVHLARVSHASLVLTSRPPQTPYLVSATASVEQWRCDESSLLLTAEAHREGCRLVFGGYPPHAPLFLSVLSEKGGQERLIQADEAGQVTIDCNLGGRLGVALLRTTVSEDRSLQ